MTHVRVSQPTRNHTRRCSWAVLYLHVWSLHVCYLHACHLYACYLHEYNLHACWIACVSLAYVSLHACYLHAYTCMCVIYVHVIYMYAICKRDYCMHVICMRVICMCVICMCVNCMHVNCMCVICMRFICMRVNCMREYSMQDKLHARMVACLFMLANMHVGLRDYPSVAPNPNYSCYQPYSCNLFRGKYSVVTVVSCCELWFLLQIWLPHRRKGKHRPITECSGVVGWWERGLVLPTTGREATLGYVDIKQGKVNMLIGVAICTLDGVHLGSPNSAHPQGANHGLHKYMHRYCIYIILIS